MDDVISDIEEPMLTPLPKVAGVAMTMSFPEAMREIILGNKVARLEWQNADYGLLKDGWLSIFTRGSFHTWSVSDGDMEGQDWVIVKELDEQPKDDWFNSSHP